MKARASYPLLLLGLVSGFAATASHAQSFTDIEVSNDATIANAMKIGVVQLGSTTAAGTSHAVRLHATQQAQEVWGSYTVPGYNQDNWVTVDDWGWVEQAGYWSPQYEQQIVGYNHFPATYDEFGNEITPAYDEPVYDNVWTGDVWVPGEQVWGITGSHQENQPVWVPDEVVPYSEWQYDAPVIHASATRSDANWVWDVPDSQGGLRTVMRLWDGGLAMAGPDGVANMALSPTALFYVVDRGAANGVDIQHVEARFGAESASHKATVAALGEELLTETRPEHIRLTQTQASAGIPQITQTQISAASASFGGVVQVNGDLKVQGTLRVPQRGDISMGEFTNGPQP